MVNCPFVSVQGTRATAWLTVSNSPNPKTCTKLPQTAETTVSRCTTPGAPPEKESPQRDSPAYPLPLTPPPFAPDMSPSPRRVQHTRPHSTCRPTALHAA